MSSPKRGGMSRNNVRIAMWSGPRNISTAMMRAWGSRDDTSVTDEPLYGHYLYETGVDHPGRDAILAVEEQDWRKVVAHLTGPVPDGKQIWFQKHMSHHLLPAVGRDWLGGVTNAFLIRDPHEVVASYMKKRIHPTIEDLGFRQQAELFREVARLNSAVPPVVDARDVLENPAGTLSALCDALEVSYSDAMLSWPKGAHPKDGVWGQYWYDAVENSNSFRPSPPEPTPLPQPYDELANACVPLYAELYAARLRPLPKTT